MIVNIKSVNLHNLFEKPGAKVLQKPRKQVVLFENEDLTKKIAANT